MAKHEMTSGVIPLRHSSLPGLIKLPRRYEKAAMGSNGISARVRKISIQPGQSALGDSLSDRLDDLMDAFMWVKQELIMLRQHDILLKRQFFNIQHSIRSLQKRTATATTTTSTTSTTSITATTTSNTTTTTTSNTTTTTTTTNNNITKNTTTTTTPTSSATPTTLTTTVTTSDSPPTINNNDTGVEDKDELAVMSNDDDVFDGVNDLLNDCEFSMDVFLVRQACSVTMLNENSEEEEEADLLTDDFFRPRTGSMRTSRDMAALARRRGSKELI
ncbi:hypothetical protein ACOMHN_061325 [Nucella lapillus]